MLKIKEWFNRYKHAEIAGIVAFGLASSVTQYFHVNAIKSVLIITYTEFLAYYFMMLYVEQKTKSKQENIFKSMILLIKEFGPAEIIDLLFSRNFFLFIFPLLIGNHTTGLIVGKIVADVVFYILTIFSYERLKRKSKLNQFSLS